MLLCTLTAVWHISAAAAAARVAQPTPRPPALSLPTNAAPAAFATCRQVQQGANGTVRMLPCTLTAIRHISAAAAAAHRRSRPPRLPPLCLATNAAPAALSTCRHVHWGADASVRMLLCTSAAVWLISAAAGRRPRPPFAPPARWRCAYPPALLHTTCPLVLTSNRIRMLRQECFNAQLRQCGA